MTLDDGPTNFEVGHTYYKCNECGLEKLFEPGERVQCSCLIRNSQFVEITKIDRENGTVTVTEGWHKRTVTDK
jgi:hypothetical protein